MGLPENMANEPLPIASLTALVKPEATVFPVNQPAPVSLQGAGQFRIVVENEEEEAEIVLVVGGASTGSWIVERAQEGTTALSFVAGTGISHELTAGAVKTFAPLSSPVLTGTPTAPTAAAKTATAQLATTAFAETAKGEAEEAVTVERERAEEAEVLLAPKASPALTGTPTAPTATALTDSTQLATTAYADGAVAVETTRAEAAEAANATAITAETTRAEAAEVLKAPLANPALTGVPTAPTAAANTNTTQIATTAAVHTAKTEAEAAADKAGAAAAAQAAAEAESIPLAQKGAASGVASLTAASIGAQLPAHHASTHAEGGTDPLTVGDLPASVVNGSAMADYVVAEVGGSIVATPQSGSALPTHTGTTSEVGTVINAALTSLAGSGHLHLALGGPYSVNDAEVVIIGPKASNFFTPPTRLIVTGDGTTKLNQGAAGKNTLVVKNGASVDLSGFQLFSSEVSKSALLLDDSGSETEISASRSRIDLICESLSTGYPAAIIKNPAEIDVPRLWAYNPNNHGLVIENTSTTTNYGNSRFGIIRVAASRAEPYAGLKLTSTHPVHFPNIITFDLVQCFRAGFYGIYSFGAKFCTFVDVDIEEMAGQPVLYTGNAEGYETQNLDILNGYIDHETAKPAITATEYTAGCRTHANIALKGSAATLLKDESNFRSTNEYDLVSENTPAQAAYSVTNPRTPVTVRYTDRSVVSPMGSNRQQVTLGSSHALEVSEMGLTVSYGSSSSGTLTIPTFVEQAFPVGAVMRLYQAGVGQLTVSPTAGVTLRNGTGYAFKQFGEAELRCVAENEWVLSPLAGGESGVGSWTALETGSGSPKLEENAAYQAVRARSEQSGNTVRLRGVLKVKTGEELKAEERIGTLPAGLRPPGKVRLGSTGTGHEYIVETNGEIKLSIAVAAGNIIVLDGLAFNLT